MQYKIGIDLGGTKAEIVLMDSQTFRQIDRYRLPTNAHYGYDHILSVLSTLVQHIEHKHNISFDQLGIGTPGAVDSGTQCMKNSNTICLNGKNLKKDLENLLNKSVIVSNDANCFAIAEATLGSAHKINPQSEVVVGLILGTGCGSGVVVNGKIIHGMHGLSGEWGHNFLDSSGGQCYCGRVGCVETIISGPALEKYYQKLTGHAVNMATIVDNYRIGLDLASLETMERFFYFFGKAVAVLVNILDPEIIVVGGGLGQIDELYVDGRTEVAKYIFNHELKTHFVKPTLGDSAGVFGAALL